MNHSLPERTRTLPRRGRIVVGCVIAILSGAIVVAQRWLSDEFLSDTSLAVPLDQFVKFPDYADGEAMAWAAFSIQHPVQAIQMIEDLKTPEERTLDAWKHLAILDPGAYRREWTAQFGGSPLETPEFQELRARAHSDILDPREAEVERERSHSPAEKERVELARFAILQPYAFNSLIDDLKSPAQLEQESISAFALRDPEAFTEVSRRAWEQSQAAGEAAANDGGSHE